MAMADALCPRSVSQPPRGQQGSTREEEKIKFQNVSTPKNAWDSVERSGVSDGSSIGVGRATGPESSSNFDNGVLPPADAPLSEQHQSPAIPASMSIPKICGQVKRPPVDFSALEAAAPGGLPMEQDDVLSSPICFTHCGLDNPCHIPSYLSYPSYPSPLSQQCSVND